MQTQNKKINVKKIECENENEINNELTIATITQAQQQEQQPETPTCETCFTDYLTEEEITDLFTFAGEGPSTLEGLCQYIDEIIQDENAILGFSAFLLGFADFHPTVTEDDVNNILDCLEEVFGVTFPRTV